MLKKKAEGQFDVSHFSQCPLETVSVWPSTNTFPSFSAAHKISELDKQKEEEAKILHNIQESSALMSVSELAKGVLYTESLTTG